MPALRLYDYAASCNCLKARILLAQLATPYERVAVDIFAGETLTAEFAEKNPLRSTPVLELPDGRYLQESNAILWHLAEGTEHLPGDAFERAQVLRWLIYEQTDVVPAIGGLRFRLVTGRLAPGDADARRRRTLGGEVLALLDRELSRDDFLVGGLPTIADVSVYSYTHAAGDAGYDLDAYPAVHAWIERVERQPRFVNDLEPYPENARPGRGRSIYDPAPA
jgi:glutathione S-transferase